MTWEKLHNTERTECKFFFFKWSDPNCFKCIEKGLEKISTLLLVFFKRGREVHE